VTLAAQLDEARAGYPKVVARKRRSGGGHWYFIRIRPSKGTIGLLSHGEYGRNYGTREAAEKGLAAYNEQLATKKASRRSTADRSSHREQVLRAVGEKGSTSTEIAKKLRHPESQVKRDLVALAKAGKLKKNIDIRWDKPRDAAQSWRFGGATVMKRKVATYYPVKGP